WTALLSLTLHPLSVEVATSPITLSPIEPSTHFSVSLSGFASEDEAEQVELSISSALHLNIESRVEGDTKYFRVSVHYDGEAAFSEGAAALHLSFSHIPESYPPLGGIQIVRMPLMDGLEKNRPIPVRQANLEAFNSYANTAEGLMRHYQLVEHVVLPTLENDPNAWLRPSNWVPIGSADAPFEGSFNGSDNTLSGLQLSFSSAPFDELGLFGVIGEGAAIENLGVLGFSMNNGPSVGGGVVARNNGGLVHNCHAKGNFEDYNIGAAGGVVGLNEGGTVRSSHAAVNIYGTSGPSGGVVGRNNGGTVTHCYATGSLAGQTATGGVVGENNGGRVQNSYSSNNLMGYPGDVGGVVGNNSGTVQNCYATGNISGNQTAFFHGGGVVGWNNGGVVENCYATGNIGTGSYSMGGVAGGGEGTVRNCVALSPSVRSLWAHTTPTRIAFWNNATIMNYARADMQLYAENALLDPESLMFGRYTEHGQNLPLSGDNSVSDPHWWTTASHWATTGGASAWDFENIWEWVETNNTGGAGPYNLPILRNVGGLQNPSVR
ncbi:MAG: hypothetical protein FWG75_09755, partial [Cystobacterineae bacterium]|nr:hypothetical protein [Cystobacterineae bacterium]